MTAPGGSPSADSEEFVLRIGQALARFGMPSHRLEDRLADLSKHLGLDGAIFAAPTSLLVDLGRDRRRRVRLTRVRPTGIDLGKLADLQELVDGVLEGRWTPEEGLAQIDEIADGPLRYGLAMRWLAHLIASCAATRFLGGGKDELLLGTMAGALLGTTSLLLSRRAAFTGLVEPLGAMIVALTAVLGAGLFPGVDVDKALLGGLIVLVPGFSIAIAVRELVSGHTTSGTTRMAAAIMTTLMLGFGVALGYRVGILCVGEPIAGVAEALPTWTSWVLLPIAAVNVAMVFQVRPRELASVVITAAVGYGALTLATDPLGRELAVFVGAFMVGIASNLLMRLRARPFGVARLPALLFLVPGGLSFLSVRSLFSGEPVVAMAAAGQVALVATAIVTGLVLADSVTAGGERAQTDAV